MLSLPNLLRNAELLPPGIAFGKEWDTHIRVSLIENVERFRTGIVKLASFISKYEKINKRV